MPEVGQALGLEHRTAQKRVSRALEKLRRIFSRRGVTATVTLIAAALSSHSIQAAPLGLAGKITATVLQGSVVAGTTLTLVKGTLHIMTCLKAKTAILIASAVLGGAAAVAAVHYHLSQGQPGTHTVPHQMDADQANTAPDHAPQPAGKQIVQHQPAGKQKVVIPAPPSAPPPPPAPTAQKQPLGQ